VDLKDMPSALESLFNRLSTVQNWQFEDRDVEANNANSI
jgi:hypothetical protein